MKRGKAIIKELLAALVVLTGLARATRAFLWRDRVAVLLYHDPDPATLDRHLTYLRKFCDLVPLTDVGAPGNGRARAAITADHLPVQPHRGPSTQPLVVASGFAAGRPRAAEADDQ
jgi:hypothetical protein